MRTAGISDQPASLRTVARTVAAARALQTALAHARREGSAASGYGLGEKPPPNAGHGNGTSVFFAKHAPGRTSFFTRWSCRPRRQDSGTMLRLTICPMKSAIHAHPTRGILWMSAPLQPSIPPAEFLMDFECHCKNSPEIHGALRGPV